jgi:hypothetical protein
MAVFKLHEIRLCHARVIGYNNGERSVLDQATGNSGSVDTLQSLLRDLEEGVRTAEPTGTRDGTGQLVARFWK